MAQERLVLWALFWNERVPFSFRTVCTDTDIFF
jgi:hypothetical protein